MSLIVRLFSKSLLALLVTFLGFFYSASVSATYERCYVDVSQPVYLDALSAYHNWTTVHTGEACSLSSSSAVSDIYACTSYYYVFLRYSGGKYYYATTPTYLNETVTCLNPVTNCLSQPHTHVDPNNAYGQCLPDPIPNCEIHQHHDTDVYAPCLSDPPVICTVAHTHLDPANQYNCLPDPKTVCTLPHTHSNPNDAWLPCVPDPYPFCSGTIDLNDPYNCSAAGSSGVITNYGQCTVSQAHTIGDAVAIWNQTTPSLPLSGCAFRETVADKDYFDCVGQYPDSGNEFRRELWCSNPTYSCSNSSEHYDIVTKSCHTCDSPKVWDAVTSTCTTCEPPLFYDSATQYCRQCTAPTVYDSVSNSCKSCSAPNVYNSVSGTCDTCSAPKIYDAATQSCIACTLPKVYEYSTKSCMTCPAPAIYDSSINSCKACDSPQVFDLLTASCKSCTAPQLYDSLTQSCQSCESPALYNPVTNSCKICPIGYFINSLGDCTNNDCPLGQSRSTINDVCVPIGTGTGGSAGSSGTGGSAGSSGTGGSAGSSGTGGSAGSSGTSGSDGRLLSVVQCRDGSTIVGDNVCPPTTETVDCTDGVSTVVCNGDPINCAILQATAKSACDLKPLDAEKDTPKISVDGSQLKSIIIDADLPTEIPRQDDKDVSSLLNFNGYSWGGGRDCPAIDSVTVYGTSITIPIEGVCQAADIVSFFLIAGSCLISFRIIAS